MTTSAGVKFREDGEVGVGVDIFYVESGGDDAYKVESQEGLKPEEEEGAGEEI